MSSIMSSQGVVLATAMAAVSAGTVILLAFGHQKLFTPTQFPISSKIVPRSCISSDGGKKKKKKKRVQFAKDVVEPSGNGEDFRKKHRITINLPSSPSSSELKKSINGGDKIKNRGMPENRVALYNGILRDRVVHRVAYSY